MTENGSNGSRDLGNTKTKSQTKKRETACKNWCFTLNNWNQAEYDALILLLKMDQFIIGKEIGENKTPHLQGFVIFDKKKRMSECKEFNKRIHWEPCKGSINSNIAYCSKDGDYFAQRLNVVRPLKVLKDEQLYEWQKKIVEIVKICPDDRTIYWYWEPKGCAGKTTFSKYLSHHYQAVPISGKKNDILYCCAEFPSDIYIMDIERSMEDYVPYGALEKVKDGYYMCAKYESKPIVRNSPHIFVFANFAPDESQMSKDRWKITLIKTVP